MSLPINIGRDYVAETGSDIVNTLNEVTTLIAVNLEKVFKSIANNPNFIGSDFWNRQGSNGIALLQEFAYWRTVLQTKAPEKVSDLIASAGSTLTPNEDGTITVNE